MDRLTGLPLEVVGGVQWMDKPVSIRGCRKSLVNAGTPLPFEIVGGGMTMDEPTRYSKYIRNQLTSSNS